jgi:lantibiotic modifying enzyme
MSAWCHGAPGIVTGRLIGRAALGDSLTGAELDDGLRTTATSERSSDHLCCGALGRADVLLSAGLELGRADLLASSRELVARVVARAGDQGFRFAPTSFERSTDFVGLFRGLPGIGYLLLRMLEPSLLPSVLAFESLGQKEDREVAK